MATDPALKHRLYALRDHELTRFTQARPRGAEALERARSTMPNGVPMSWMSGLYTHPPMFVEAGHGATFTDIDGNVYIDFKLADTSMFTGYGVDAIIRAVAKRTNDGPQFLLPTQDAAEVATRLAERFGLPFWQFTLSATQANAEAMRTARALTGRDEVLMFDGKYHGHCRRATRRARQGGCGAGGPRGAWRRDPPCSSRPLQRSGGRGAGTRAR